MAATDDVRLRFDHVSIAVKSIDRAYDFFAKYFPIKLRGAKSLDEQVSGSFYWQDFHLGGFVVELIEDPPGKPVGSTAARRFIEEVKPDVCISGHIHESAGVDRIGATQIFNAGPFKGGGYIVVRTIDGGEGLDARLEFL